ncbi:MAG: COQ9 family protein [Pseudomonadota bacterium]
MDQSDKNRLLDAALNHVMFDGWGDAAFAAAVAETEIDLALAKSLFPRKGTDMAVAFHQRGDADMKQRMAAENLSTMRYRDRVAACVRARLEVVSDHKEAVRRGSTLFALPQHSVQGAKLLWGTADAIWVALGDSSNDYNWYTKRATLSGVYGATVLYWLGDTSDGHDATWDFLDRRIDNVMQFEKVKAQVNDNPIASKFLAGPNWFLSQIKPPTKFTASDMPGSTAQTRDAQ